MSNNGLRMEFARRRARFMERIGAAVAIVPSAPETIRTNDSRHKYRQDSDFYYLTGFDEPQSVLVLAPRHGSTKTALFVRPSDAEREQWDGKRAGVEGAQERLGVDAAYPIEALDERLPELLETADTLYYAFDRDDAFNRRVVDLVRKYRVARQRADGGPRTVADPAGILHEMRMQKTAFEIEALRRAVTISGEGHIAAMRYARPGMHEYEIQAILEFVFTSRGAQSAAYPSIVAAGANGTVLHYTANRARVRDDELVLIDAAAEVDFSCGDITRTWPMSGKFSPEQRAVYEIVLAAQQRCIELCRPGARFAGEVNDAAIRVITEGLIDLGLLRGAIDENIEEKRYRRFYMHRIGHYLGLDVHDVGFYRQEGDWRALAPGMVVTIEPGIYIPQDDDVEARFRGIAVRIEDDILITESGSDNLSSNTPKTIEDIERTIAEGRESKVPLPA